MLFIKVVLSGLMEKLFEEEKYLETCTYSIISPKVN